MRAGCPLAELLRDPPHDLKAQELHDALINAHITIEDNLEEKIRLRDQGPDIEASTQSAALLTDRVECQPADGEPC